MKQIGMMCLIALGLMGQTIVNPNGNGGGAPTTNPTGGANNYAAINGQTFTGAISAPGITDSNATAGQIWYGGTGGVRTGSASLLFDSTNNVTVPTGSAAHPGINFAGNTATGVYSSSNQLAFSNGGVLVGYFDSSYRLNTTAAVLVGAAELRLASATGTPASIFGNNSGIGIGPSNTSLGANTTLSVLNRTALQGTAVYIGSDNNGDTSATTTQLTIVPGGSQGSTALVQYGTPGGSGTGTSTPTLVQSDSTFGTSTVGKNCKFTFFHQTASQYDYCFGISNSLFEMTTGTLGQFGFFQNAVSTPILMANISTTGINVPTASVIGFGASSTADSALSRDSAGLIDFGTGAQGSTAGSWKATAGATIAVATSALKTCTATTGTPWRAAVNDATAPALGVALTGGGTVFALVHCSLTTGTYIVDGL